MLCIVCVPRADFFLSHTTILLLPTRIKMYSTRSISASVATALLAGLSSASHPTPMSHNVSEFKMVYEMTGIVPEVVASIDPAVSFYMGYMEQDGDMAMLMPGDTISLFEAQQEPFEFLVEGISNVTNATDETRYLIYIVRLFRFFC